MAIDGGSPCGACKFLRRKCASDCVFAPYFYSEQSPERFAAIHKVFGASNVAKLLLRLPAGDRAEAALTICYEAQARIRNPVYGCVAHIFALHNQVAFLQSQLEAARAQLLLAAQTTPPLPGFEINCYSMENFCGDQGGVNLQQEEVFDCLPSRKRPPQTDLTELQELALAMTNNQT